MWCILIIDDEDPIRDLLRAILERAGYYVLEAPNGAVGLQVYRAKAVDLVITDIRMPVKDGLETIQELKQDFPDAKVIAMSGLHTEPHSLLTCAQKLGAVQTLPKPFDMTQVLAAVQEILPS
jgi:DNA-binding response OmpR family regulator